MKLLIVLGILVYTQISRSVPIIGETSDASVGMYKYVVALRYQGIFAGAGSILNARWILTCAHCVADYTNDDLNVVAGTKLREGDNNEQIYNSELCIPHPRFKTNDEADIGLIRVNRDIEFGSNIQPVALPTEEFYKAGDTAKVLGWGFTTYHNRYNYSTLADKLQELDVTIMDNEVCKKESKDILVNPHIDICTVGIPGKGSCQGDSGGPLIANGTQIGVVAGGLGCAEGTPDLYSRVYAFKNWIASEQAKF